jgi:uroporphyrinogen-III synthase
MTPNLEGRMIALAEGRQLEELARMLEREGARILRCPLISMHDSPNTDGVLAWIRQLIADRFSLLVLMTGEGVRRLLGFAERAGIREAYVQALGRTPNLTRGPKPNQALKELGLNATQVADSPTTAGLIATLSQMQLEGQHVALTRHGNANPELEDFLHQSGALVYPVQPYVYAPAAEEERVVSLMESLAAGTVDVFVFTSSPQVDRLYEVAEKQGRLALLDQGLRRTRVAAVGPVVADNLRHRLAPVHICPEQGFVMKNLVQMIKKTVGGVAETT